MTRVSVFMSSYNHAESLRQSIDSALQQTFADFELFIIDDASTDDSWAIIQSCKDPRLHAERNDRNRNDREAMRRVIMETARGSVESGRGDYHLVI